MEENLIKKYWQTENHDLSSLLKIKNVTDKDKKINSIKKEINRILKELEEKKEELGTEISSVYSQKYEPVKETIIIHYVGNSTDCYFDFESGYAVDSLEEMENFVEYKVYRKRDDVEIVVGYDYDLASIIVRKYKYNIASNNSKITMKLIKESVISFLENKMASVYFGDEGIFEEENQITEKEIGYGDLNALGYVKNHDFINKLFGVNYEGALDLKELKERYKDNKAFEIIIKTSPKEIVDNLLKQNYDVAQPIHKIMGITIDTYNLAIKKGIIKNLFSVLKTIEIAKKQGIEKTEKEWLDYIEEIKAKEEDLDFYQINYTSRDWDYSNTYDDNAEGLLITLLSHYFNSRNIFKKYYTLGKYTNYVVEETINQGYERIRDFLDDLDDYLKMCEHENIKPTLYSSYLKQTHDIAQRNHKIIVEKENEEIFKERYKDFKTYVGKKYMVVAPHCTDDLKKEGDNLNHCVASYIKRVIDGTCLIYFLRVQKDESLVTLEVKNNTIAQVKGKHNRKPTNDEVKALQDFAKCRNLQVNF